MNTFETSETTAKLDAALAKAQGEFGSAMKDSPNPAFKSKYADISSILGAVRPALSKHGIAVTQWPVHTDNNRLHLITRVAHDGEWIISEFSFPVEKQTAHGHGGAITYARRYALAAILGVIDEDDDGNSATQGVTGFPPGNPEVKYPKYPADAKPTPGVVRARDNNGFYKQLQQEIDELKSKADAREWRKMRAQEIDERVSPEAMFHLSERYEERIAALP